MKRELLAMLLAVETFRHKQPKIPSEAIALFLAVATREGRSLSEIAARLNMTASTVGRRVDDLAGGRWQKTPGHGLLRVESEPWDRRTKRVYLTPLGKAFASELAALLSSRSPR